MTLQIALPLIGFCSTTVLAVTQATAPDLSQGFLPVVAVIGVVSFAVLLTTKITNWHRDQAEAMRRLEQRVEAVEKSCAKRHGE
jgi:hypothetical protein